MMRRLFPAPLLSLALLALWLLLNNASQGLGQWLLGAFLGVLVPLLTQSLRPTPVRFRRPLVALRLFMQVGYDVIVWNWRVLRGTLAAGKRMPRGGFVEEPPPRRKKWVTALLKPLRGAARERAERHVADDGAGVSFDGFLTILNETLGGGGRDELNEHWAPQSDLCALHEVRYDFVGSMNRMGRDLRALSSYLGFEVALPAGKEYGWEGNRNASRLLARHYTSRALVSRVAQMYRMDVAVPLNGISFTPNEAFGAALPGRPA